MRISTHSLIMREAASTGQQKHDWHERFGLTVCRVCGYVQNEKNRNAACRGPVRLALRTPTHD